MSAPVATRYHVRRDARMPEAVHALDLPHGWVWDDDGTGVRYLAPARGGVHAPALTLPTHDPVAAQWAAVDREGTASALRHHHRGASCDKCHALAEAAALREYARAIQSRTYVAQHRRSTVRW